MNSRPKTPGVVATIISSDCQEHIKWLKKVFEAEQYELYLSDDSKRVMHCVLSLNGGILYISDTMEELSNASKEEPSGFYLNLELENPADMWNRATSNGASVVADLKVLECGYLSGCFKDPYGFTWCLIKVEGEKRTLGVTPYILHGGDCKEHIQWITSAFDGGVQDEQVKDEHIVHCAVKVNDGVVYLADCSTRPDLKYLTTSGKINCLMCHVERPDPYPLWEKLLQQGATSTIELKVQFWGGTYGAARDTKGLEWSLSKSVPVNDKPSLLTPYILSHDCDGHIDWIQKVFEGSEVKEIYRTKAKKIMHCRLIVNEDQLFLCDASCEPDADKISGASTEGIILQAALKDPDYVWKKAMAHGSEVIEELKQQDWGGYYGCIRDPMGIKWGIIKRCER